jgi:putative chitinase
MTEEQLKQIYKYASDITISTFYDSFCAAMAEFEINTPLRQAAFVAQVGHESGEFRYTIELASGNDYEGRKDLGNIYPGDGIRFKGRGLIQITGRANYAEVGKALDIDCVNNPHLLQAPVCACRSAGYFWKKHGLNELADAEEFISITKRINGGTTGEAEREQIYMLAKAVLNA